MHHQNTHGKFTTNFHQICNSHQKINKLKKKTIHTHTQTRKDPTPIQPPIIKRKCLHDLASIRLYLREGKNYMSTNRHNNTMEITHTLHHWFLIWVCVIWFRILKLENGIVLWFYVDEIARKSLKIIKLIEFANFKMNVYNFG